MATKLEIELDGDTVRVTRDGVLMGATDTVAMRARQIAGLVDQAEPLPIDQQPRHRIRVTFRRELTASVVLAIRGETPEHAANRVSEVLYVKGRPGEPDVTTLDHLVDHVLGEPDGWDEIDRAGFAEQSVVDDLDDPIRWSEQ